MSHPPIDPLAGYTPDWRAKLRQAGSWEAIDPQPQDDPLAGYTSDWRDRARASGLTDQRQSTAVGRRQVEAEDLATQTQKYQELLARPDLKPEQRKRLERLIKKNEQGSWTRRDTGENDPLQNFTRGVLAGIPKAFTSLGDLGAAAVNAVTPGQIAQPIRDAAKEASAFYDESMNPQGKAGLAGDIAGGIVGGMAGYGLLTGATASGLLRVLPEGGKLAGLIRAAQTGNVVQRVGGQTLIGIPLDAFQAATMEDASTEDKVKQFLISTGSNALFAGIMPASKPQELPGPKPNLEAKPVDVSAESAQKASTLGAAPNETTQAEITAKYQAAMEHQKAMEIQRAATAEWKAANPGKKWKELTDVEKKQYIIQYKSRLEKAQAAAQPSVEVKPTDGADVQPPPASVAAEASPAAPIREAVQEYAETGDPTKIQQVASPQPVVDPSGRQESGLPSPDEVVVTNPHGDKLPDSDVAALAQSADVDATTQQSNIPPVDAVSAENARIAIEDARTHVDDTPATVEAQIDPPPPVEQLLAKMSKPKKNPNFVLPPRDPGLDPHTGAIGYTANVTLADGRIQPIEIYNFMASNTNAKSKMYRWRYAGETDADWRTAGFNFASVEAEVKADIAKTGAFNPMTQEQLNAIEAQVKAGKRPVMPLEKMTVNQLTKHIDRLNDLIDALPPEKVGSAEHQVIEREIEKAAKQKVALGREMAEAPSAAVGVAKTAVKEANMLSAQMADLRTRMDLSSDPEAIKGMQAEYLQLEARRKEILTNARDAGAIIKDDASATVVDPKERPAAIDISQISPETRASWFLKPVDEMTPKVMEAHALDLVEKINQLPRNEAAPYVKRYNELKERYVRLMKMRKTGFMTVNFPPELGGGVVGFMMGAATGDTDEERSRNAMYGLMLGVGVGYGARKIHMKYETTKVTNLLPGEAEIKKWVRTAAEQEGLQKFKPFLSRLESWYQKIMRPSWAIEKATLNAGGKKLPAYANPGKLAAMFGRWVSQTEDFIFGRPSMEDVNGMSMVLKDVSSVVEIANTVDGDTETLGNLMASLATIEQHASGKVTSPIPLADAVRFAQAAPQKFHDAAREARKLNLALVDVLVDAGVIDPAARMHMATQQWYAPLERIFGNAPKPTNAPPPIGASTGSGMPATNPVKARSKGKSPHLIANPFETMVGNIPRILRAAERNKAKVALVKLYHANKDAFEGLMSPAPRSKKANVPAFNAQVNAIKQALQLNSQTATGIASAFGDMHLDPTSNTMSVWNNGVLETYRLDPYLAEAYRALHPEELDLMWDLVGIPARMARKGIVSNPVFLLYQAFRDNWQATLNSQYGFRFGVDWFKGWWESMKNSAEYKQYIARGGGNSLYAQREVLSASKTLKAIKVKGITAEGSALGVAVKQMKSMSFLEAYHTIMTPIAEAARVGEYLRARGHGAPAIEAVYAAKEITGNYSQIAPLIKGLNRATLFLNPAIKAMDQAFYASGIHPWRTPEAGRSAAASRYLIKAFLTLTLPSMLLKVASKDDEEVDQLSRSEFGRRFWFIRNPAGGGIIKLPKPQFEGQIFATGVEAAIDAYREKNPEEFSRWAEAVQNDVAMNLLPVVATVPYSLVANKDLGTGVNITPYDKENVDPEFQAGQRTSVAARVVGGAIAPVSSKVENETWRRALSPSGLDYIAKSLGGTLTTEFLHSLSVVVNWNAKGYLAPAEELPIIRGMLVNYPSNSVKSVEEFYRVAEIVDRKAKTFQHIAETDPTRAGDYYTDNAEWINMAELYAQTRKDIAELRQAAEDVSNIPGDPVSPVFKRQLNQEMTRRVIQLTSSINDARKLMR